MHHQQYNHNPSCLVVLLLLCFVEGSLDKATGGTMVPLVIWHGMGDNCCSSFGAGAFKLYIEKLLPGIYVKSLQFGNNLQEDSYNSFFLNANIQIEMACKDLSADSKLTNGFNAIGFSQGAQFLRALVQRCGTVHIYNLISVGGQHQGVFGFPNCMGETSIFCHFFRRFLTLGVYLSFIQDYIVQAEYYHDPYDEEEYKLFCIFLPDINQEITFNPVYKERLSNLSNFVLIKFTEDTMIQPIETSWFGFYRSGQAVETYSLFESNIYTEDLLGLQYLHTNGRLHFLSYPGYHLGYDRQWFTQNVLPFINRTLSIAQDLVLY